MKRYSEVKLMDERGNWHVIPVPLGFKVKIALIHVPLGFKVKIALIQVDDTDREP